MSRGNIFGHNFRKLLFLFGYVFDFFGQEKFFQELLALNEKEAIKELWEESVHNSTN